MNFVNYSTMIEDVRQWSHKIPKNTIAVTGVPRSGIFPATVLSLHRNIHYVPIESLWAGERLWEREIRDESSTRWVPSKDKGIVLVIEDAVNTGSTIAEAMEKIPAMEGVKFVAASLYSREEVPEHIRFTYRVVEMPRAFEWMIFKSRHMLNTMVDLDGVLCEDPTHQEGDSGSGLRKWLHHMNNAKPRFIPARVVIAIATSRLEKYRRQTKHWLHRYDIGYGKLHMSPYRTAAERQTARDHAIRKAMHYAAEPEATLFVESNLKQAQHIARASKKPVLCTETMEMF
jgi:uncharacterized HAD superfamily protein/adenine/guanine phosphoribosyltransferase-like PRPP-binding protein